jgi:hypothetical protein
MYEERSCRNVSDGEHVVFREHRNQEPDKRQDRIDRVVE